MQQDNNNKNIFKGIVLLCISIFFASYGAIAIAQIPDSTLDGIGTTGDKAGFSVNTTNNQPETPFVPAWINYINGLLFLMAALFLVLMIYAGWLWMTAHGNEEQIRKAKSILINSLIAFGLIIAARFIVEIALSLIPSPTVTSTGPSTVSPAPNFNPNL